MCQQDLLQHALNINIKGPSALALYFSRARNFRQIDRLARREGENMRLLPEEATGTKVI